MEHHVEIVQTLARAQEVADLCAAETTIGFDTETHHLRPEKGSRVVGYGFGVREQTFYVPVRHERIPHLLAFEYGPWANVDAATAAEIFKPMLEADRPIKHGMNLKHEIRHLRFDGIELGTFEDIQHLIRLTHPGLNFQRGHTGGYKLKPLLQYLLKWAINERDELQDWLLAKGQGKYAFYLAPIDLVARYMRLDVQGPPALRALAWPRVERDYNKQVARGTQQVRGFKFLWELENKLVRVLADMEDYGVRVDEAWLAFLEEDLTRKIDEFAQQIMESAGKEFDPSKDQEVAEVLFGHLGIEAQVLGAATKKFPLGRPSVAEAVLNTIDHPIVKLVVKYRLERKLLQYVLGKKGFKPNVANGRIHGFIRADGASTGRLSMADPNMENLPTRKTDSDNRIRKLVLVDSDEFTLTSIDLSQIQPRLLVHYSNDELLIQGYWKGLDIYLVMGGQVFRCKPEEITESQRQEIKQIVLGIMFGKGVPAIARDLKISEDRAQSLKDRVLQGGVQMFVSACYEQLRASAKGANGLIYTLMGRPRLIPRDAGHIGVNTVIQGGEADLFKLGLLRCWEFLHPHKSYPLLPVHDEVLFMMHNDEFGVLYDLLDCLTQFPEYHLRVPLEANIQFYTGGSWGEGGEELSVYDLLQTERDALFPNGVCAADHLTPWYQDWLVVKNGYQKGESVRTYVNAMHRLSRSTTGVGS